MALIELNNISLKQGGFELQVPQLALRAGCLYVLKGQNGSGKSTLLRLLALLQQPQAGMVWFNNLPVAWKAEKLQKLRQNITLLEQNPWLFNGNVEKNLAFGLKIRGIYGPELQHQVAQALDIVGLNGFQKRRAKELSGGESRRVALARALCLQPQLLLLDEPTANLDAQQVEIMEQFLVALPQKGMTVVIASHDRDQAKRLGGETIKMKDGRLMENQQDRSAKIRLQAI
jgi:tungstate transport system ATP-binding protein